MRLTSSILCMGLVLSLGWLNGAAAQHGRGHGRMKGHGQAMGQVRQDLNLTEEQKQQVEALREDFQKQQQELRAQVEAGTLSREELQTQMKAAAEAHRIAFEALLTDEQRQKLTEWRQNHPAGPGMGEGMGPGMGKGWGRGMGRAGGPGMGKMAEALGLSEEQKAQWQELQKQQWEQMKQLHQSGQRPDPQAMRQLREERQKAFEAILTPPQLQKLEELKKNWKEKHPGKNTSQEPASKPATKEESWGQVKSQGK